MSSSIELEPNLVNDYSRNGFIRTAPLLNGPDFDALVGEVEALVTTLPEDQPKDKLLNWHLKADVLLKLALHPAILAHIKAILGPDLALFNTRLMVKPARSGRAIGWHQDIAYFPIEPPKVVTLWLALNEVGEDNSPLLVSTGCHQNGIYPHRTVTKGQVFNEAIDNEACRLWKPLALTLQKGAAVFMDGFMPHASERNRSSHNRTAFIARYIATSTRLLRNRRALYGPDYPLFWISGRKGANIYTNSTPAIS